MENDKNRPQAVSRRRWRLAMIALVAVAGLLIARSFGHREWHRAEGVVWNTTYHIVYEGAENLNDSVSAIFRQVEMSLSVFNRSSLVSRINRNETDSADALIARVMDVSMQVGRLSGGRFDPTVSPLVNLWGFGYTRRPAGDAAPQPTQSEIDSALSAVGIGECRLSHGRVQKKSPATTFNFSAVAKGFGCDLVGDMLRRNGCRNYMVEIGGEMVLSGHNRSRRPWRVQIDAPVADEVSPATGGMRVVELTDCAVATSGNYRNFRVDSLGHRLGHTISAVDGRPYSSAIVSATVVAPTCALADALATACMASTESQAVEMLGQIADVRGLLCVAEGDSLRQVSVNGF